MDAEHLKEIKSMTLGERIQTLRKEQGMSQEALAEAAGVSRQSVSKWENDAALPDIDNVIQLSRLFGVRTDALLTGETAITDADAAETPEPPAEEIPPEKCSPAKQKATGDDTSAKKSFPCKALAVILAAVLVSTATGLFFLLHDKGGGKNNAEKAYPYVLVHGMGGWGTGSGMNSLARYWGAETGDLAEYLRGEGYEVYTPTVGPISSAWDRACELYAALTGTRVDYGAAHAAAHRHNRYGRVYTESMLPQWDGKHKINLVGHSFGGETVRLLTSLLAYGDETELADGAEDISPLFTGGKEDWVHSVTTLCSPHNGSTLTCVLDTLGGLVGMNSTTELLASICFAAAGVANPLNGTYDFMLDQFGITDVTGGRPEILSAISALLEHGDDNAAADLSPDGAAELNQKIRMVDGIYYFSYTYCTTEEGDLLYIQKPTASTLAVLKPFALAMGSYNGTTPGGIRIDETWHANDGLVSVVSAQYPQNDPHVDLNADAPRAGVWNVAPVRSGHHGTVIGLGADADETHNFYVELFKMIDGCR